MKYGIVNTEPGQFEVYIDLFFKENQLWETDPYIKKDAMEDWTTTSSFLNDVLLPLGIDLLSDADVRRIFFCEMYVQDYFPEQTHRFNDKELIERLKRREITLKRLYTKAETRKIKGRQEKKEGREPKKKGREPRVSDELKE